MSIISHVEALLFLCRYKHISTFQRRPLLGVFVYNYIYVDSRWSLEEFYRAEISNSKHFVVVTSNVNALYAVLVFVAYTSQTRDQQQSGE